MILKDFIMKYSYQSVRGWSEDLFDCKFDQDEGFILPEGFYIVNKISRIPIFIIAVNRDEKAIIRYSDNIVSLSIYDTQVQMEAALRSHKEYYEERFEKYLNLRHFCESISKLGVMEVVDAITNELHKTNEFEDCKKKEIYMEDLMVLLRLFTDTTFPKNQVRVNFIRDAYPLLRELEKTLISVQSMNLVKISEVYFTMTDQTFYVLEKDHKDSIKYITDNLEQTRKLLKIDGWSPCAKVARNDGAIVDILNRDNEYIAIWEG